MKKYVVIRTQDGNTFIGNTYESNRVDMTIGYITGQDVLEIGKAVSEYRDKNTSKIDWKVGMVADDVPLFADEKYHITKRIKLTLPSGKIVYSDYYYFITSDKLSLYSGCDANQQDLYIARALMIDYGLDPQLYTCWEIEIVHTTKVKSL